MIWRRQKSILLAGLVKIGHFGCCATHTMTFRPACCIDVKTSVQIFLGTTLVRVPFSHVGPVEMITFITCSCCLLALQPCLFSSLLLHSHPIAEHFSGDYLITTWWSCNAKMCVHFEEMCANTITYGSAQQQAHNSPN